MFSFTILIYNTMISHSTYYPALKLYRFQSFFLILKIFFKGEKHCILWKSGQTYRYFLHKPLICIFSTLRHVMGKTCLWVFRPLLTQTNRVTEDYKRLTSSNLQSRGIVFCNSNKGWFPWARDIYSPKVLVIPRNRWLRLNMTEKLFTRT